MTEEKNDNTDNTGTQLRSEPTRQEPGALRTEGAHILLHTKKARSLVEGRKPSERRPRVFGLKTMAGWVGSIWDAAKNDDPYADVWLLRIEETIDANKRKLRDIENQLDQIFRADEGIVHVDIASSTAPVPVPLEFKAPHANLAARLLAQYDKVARRILTARHYALITNTESERLLGNATRFMRAAFQSVGGCRITGLCREDVRQRTARALQFEKELGPVPQDILDGTRRPKHAPAVADERLKAAAAATKRAERNAAKGSRPVAEVDPEVGDGDAALG